MYINSGTVKLFIPFIVGVMLYTIKKLALAEELLGEGVPALIEFIQVFMPVLVTKGALNFVRLLSLRKKYVDHKRKFNTFIFILFVFTTLSVVIFYMSTAAISSSFTKFSNLISIILYFGALIITFMLNFLISLEIE